MDRNGLSDLIINRPIVFALFINKPIFSLVTKVCLDKDGLLLDGSPLWGVPINN